MFVNVCVSVEISLGEMAPTNYIMKLSNRHKHGYFGEHRRNKRCEHKGGHIFLASKHLIKLEICRFLYVVVFTNIRNATREVLSVTTRFLQRRPLWRKCTEVGTLDEPTLFGNSYMR